MSLKDFHVIFIALAILCSGGFWAWADWNPDVAKELKVLALANLSGSLAIGLFIYGLWYVIKKSRTIPA